ncbi:hypothetical protein STTU_2942 [Streptomyces sp. Tu6071]|nr:hypothetical protein STTU_2942 [Streptomyces sp. Tu6071]
MLLADDKVRVSGRAGKVDHVSQVIRAPPRALVEMPTLKHLPEEADSRRLANGPHPAFEAPAPEQFLRNVCRSCLLGQFPLQIRHEVDVNGPALLL